MAIWKTAVTLRNQHGMGPSIDSGCVLIIRLHRRLVARGICNRVVIRNIARRILIVTPARSAHLMTQEGYDADQECSAHEKRRRQHRQALEHKPGSLPSRAISAAVQTPATCRKPASSRAPEIARDGRDPGLCSR